MKLYYSPGACSLACHIVACEAGIAIELEKVDLKTKRTQSGSDFFEINPKGNVPVLSLDDGSSFTESTAIMQFLADLKPACELAPPAGTMARYRLQEWLGFINSELHKRYSPLFNPATPDTARLEQREEQREEIQKLYAWVDEVLATRPWLLGERFCAADAYLFTVTNWAPYVDLDLSQFSAIAAFQQRVASRPHVREALLAEGLMSG